MMLYAEVILPLPLEKGFVYRVPEALKDDIAVGSRVLIPFSHRTLTGFVVKLRRRRLHGTWELKEVLEVLDDSPVFSRLFLSFTHKLAAYFYTPWGELLKAALPPSLTFESKVRYTLTEIGREGAADLDKEDQELVDILKKRPYTRLYLGKRLQDQRIAFRLRRLIRRGLVQPISELQRESPRSTPKIGASQMQLEMDFSLDASTYRLAESVREKIAAGGFFPFLLQAPADKREAFYFYLMRQCLSREQRVLLLVPEISSIRGFLDSCEKKLGRRAAYLHSRLTKARREGEWRRILAGEVDVIIGPRSALLSQIEDLGLIIVEEEQDDSFYQRESPIYDARLGARIRAREENCVVVYGSAAPRVEAKYRANRRKNLLQAAFSPPQRKVEIIDDRRHQSLISPRILSRMGDGIHACRPLLVFCSRRGYASFVFCPRCSFVPRCRNCDAALRLHKDRGQLSCHHCRFSEPAVSRCPRCGGNVMRWRGPGIESIAEELGRRFPRQRIVVFEQKEGDRSGDHERIRSRFLRGEIDILMGTPVMAHQLALPPVDLLVIFYPEVILSHPAFQAGQRTFQYLNQLLRFSAAGSRSHLMIQTALPHHHCIRFAARDDYEGFYRHEIQYRRIMRYPPFATLVEIVFAGENLRSLAHKTRAFRESLSDPQGGIEVLGPALAPVSPLRGKSRVQIILKAGDKRRLDRILKKPLAEIKAPKSVYVYGS